MSSVHNQNKHIYLVFHRYNFRLFQTTSYKLSNNSLHTITTLKDGQHGYPLFTDFTAWASVPIPQSKAVIAGSNKNMMFNKLFG
jgi:hypothetical protein